MATAHSRNPREGEPYDGIAEDANRWIFVHIGQLLLVTSLAILAADLTDAARSGRLEGVGA